MNSTKTMLVIISLFFALNGCGGGSQSSNTTPQGFPQVSGMWSISLGNGGPSNQSYINLNMSQNEGTITSNGPLQGEQFLVMSYQGGFNWEEGDICVPSPSFTGSIDKSGNVNFSLGPNVTGTGVLNKDGTITGTYVISGVSASCNTSGTFSASPAINLSGTWVLSYNPNNFDTSTKLTIQEGTDPKTGVGASVTVTETCNTCSTTTYTGNAFGNAGRVDGTTGSVFGVQVQSQTGQSLLLTWDATCSNNSCTFNGNSAMWAKQ